MMTTNAGALPLLLLVAAPLFASPFSSPPPVAPPVEARQVVDIPQVDTPPTIDGALTDEVWTKAARLELPFEIDPGENVPADARTVCYILHDATTLYVGFRAEDPDPSEIRAHLSDRDAIWRDDMIGFMFDTFNDERRGFEIFVNPVGVQADLSRNDVGSGDSEDSTWDAIWDAGARITPFGWEAEIAIPFSQIRIARTAEPQIWSFLPFRARPRSARHQYASVKFDRSVNCFFCQAPKIRGFAGVEPGKNLELFPTLTGRKTEVREEFPNGGFSTDVSKLDPGVSLRWGVTPNLSLGAAVNPDFSQVEADVAQLDVNNRYALFYSEKRPFFLEGADFFKTPITAVHTRQVADPDWGIKLTGKEGKSAIGAFIARDGSTNLLLPSNEGYSLDGVDGKSTDAVFRYRHDVGESSTIGVLYTDRSGEGDYRNQLWGVDGFFRFSPTDQVRVQLLDSKTTDPATFSSGAAPAERESEGLAGSFLYSHDQRNWSGWLWHERYDPGFRADLGYIPRIDMRDTGLGGQWNWWAEPGEWWNRANLGVEGGETERKDGVRTDAFVALFGYATGPMQSSLNFRVARRKELWLGTEFDEDRGTFFFNIRPTGDFTTSLGGVFGEYADYSNVAADGRARSGNLTKLYPGITWNLGEHVYIQVDHTWERFDVDGGRLYLANLTQAKVVWQFDVRTFVRAVFQYTDVLRDSSLWGLEDGNPATDPVPSREKYLFTQLLFSWKLNPQTMLFLGYSDNRIGWQDESLAEDARLGLRQADRTVFLKIGYAWLL
jgi:hypothetical protein